MSIVRLAARICLSQALIGATFAGDRVFDSRIMPLDQAPPDGGLPMIMVLSDDDNSSPEGRDVSHAKRNMDLIIETIIGTSIEKDGITIPETDAGLEVTLDLMHRQIFRTIQNPRNPWAEMLRKIVTSIDNVISRRASDSAHGTRFAARQIIVSVDTLNEPPFGPVEGVWADFVALLAGSADEDLAALAEIIRAEIEAPDLYSWQRVQAGLNLTLKEFRDLGIAPAFEPNNVPSDVQEAPLLEEVSTSDGYVIDQAAIEENDP